MGVLDDYYEPSCKEAFFQCGAVELAIKLLDKYLYCHQSEILVRIVETEAYPGGMLQQAVRRVQERTPELKKIFCVERPFPNNAGVVVGVNASLYDRQPLHNRGGLYLYITAGSGSQESRGVVLVRSCAPHTDEDPVAEEPAYLATIQERRGLTILTGPMRNNLLLNSAVVGKALGNDWESNSTLYEEGGVELLQKKAVPVWEDSESATPPVFCIFDDFVLHGPRILPKSKYVHDDLYGDGGSTELLLRYALETQMKYDYEKKKGEKKANLVALPQSGSIILPSDD